MINYNSVRKLFIIVLGVIFLAGIIKFSIELYEYFTTKVTPEQKFESAVVIDEKRQGFFDGSDYWHFTVDSRELKEYFTRLY
jgi:hypothetical protein